MKRKIIRLFSVALFLAGFGIFVFPYAYDRYSAYRSDKVMENFNSELNEYKNLLDDPSVSREIERIKASYEAGKTDGKENFDELEKKYTKEDTDNGISGENSWKDVKNLLQLYSDMCDYNSKIFAVGQQNIKDPFSYEKPPIDLKQYGFKDNVIGIITIDAMKVEMPLYLGASKSNMKKGAVVLGQTSMPTGQPDTNMVIAAHRGFRGMAMFRDIQKLSLGDSIIIRTPFETFIYEVVQTKVILPNENDSVMIVPGKRLITLLTCHPYTKNSHRYLVYGELREINGNDVKGNGESESGNTVIGDSENESEKIVKDGEDGRNIEEDGKNIEEDGKNESVKESDGNENGIQSRYGNELKNDHEIKTQEGVSFEEDEKIVMLERWIPVVGIFMLILLTVICVRINKKGEIK